jgi:hypothetical protein
MAKSDKEIVRDILLAQGIKDEPTPAAVAVYNDAAFDVWTEATRDAEYDANVNA